MSHFGAKSVLFVTSRNFEYFTEIFFKKVKIFANQRQEQQRISYPFSICARMCAIFQLDSSRVLIFARTRPQAKTGSVTGGTGESNRP